MNNTKDCCLVFDGVCCATDLPLDEAEGIAGDEFNDTDNTVCVKIDDIFNEFSKGGELV